jgi:dihydroorotase/N-acyl-D-amino-acid deacylase
LQAAGAANWGLQAPALERIEQARLEGIDIAFDCYPYVAGSSVLTLLLPQWVLDGGTERMLSRLRDRSERARVAEETVATSPWRWEDIYISAVGSQRNQQTVGKHLEAIGRERGIEPVEAALDLLLEESGSVNMLSFSQSEENLRQALTHPLSLIISDGFYVKGRPHPRLHGTFPLLLGTISRKRGWLPLEEAIRKITAAPAERFGIQGRGRLEAGAFADIAVFDPDQIDSAADYNNPERPPAGVRYLFRNGEIIFQSAK